MAYIGLFEKGGVEGLIALWGHIDIAIAQAISPLFRSSYRRLITLPSPPG